jgi:prepilin-type N-terminal cleavage/methylation domain-containing protein
MGAARRRAADEQGFTLVELLVVVFIVGVVGAVTTTGVIRGMRTTEEAQDRADAQAATRTAAERVSRELRMADPLRYATAQEVRLDVARGGGVTHFRYVVAAAGDRWDLIERRWNLDWSEYQADTQDPGDPPDSERTLIADLTDPDVFAFRDVDGTVLTEAMVDDGPDGDDGDERARQAYTADLSLERFVADGRSPVDVATHVTIRNR